MSPSRSPRRAPAAHPVDRVPAIAGRSRGSWLAVAGLATAALTLGAAPTAGAQDAAGPPATVDVLDLTFPILDLELPISSLDGSISRSEAGRETRITLAADILFAFDRATLSGRAKSRIDQVLDQLREAKPRTVRIEGHTDDKGSPGYNVRLSKRRAQAVERALGSALGGAKVTVVGRGEADPVASNATKDGTDSPKGRAKNRRVEIRLPRAG